jgi:hypothetical protein
MTKENLEHKIFITKVNLNSAITCDECGCPYKFKGAIDRVYELASQAIKILQRKVSRIPKGRGTIVQTEYSPGVLRENLKKAATNRQKFDLYYNAILYYESLL